MTNTGQFVRRICRHCSVVGEHQYIGETHIMCASCSSVGCDTADAIPRKTEPIEANARRVLGKRVDALAPTLPPSNGHAAAEPAPVPADERLTAEGVVELLHGDPHYDGGGYLQGVLSYRQCVALVERYARQQVERATALHARQVGEVLERTGDDHSVRLAERDAEIAKLVAERDQLKAELAAAREKADWLREKANRYESALMQVHNEVHRIVREADNPPRDGKEPG